MMGSQVHRGTLVLKIDCSNQQLSGFALMTDASRLRDPQYSDLR